MGFGSIGSCCCAGSPTTCRATIGLQAPTSCTPPAAEYSAGALTGVVTDSGGHVVTDFVHMAPGAYRIDVTAADPICTTSFPSGTPGPGFTGFSTCLTFDPDTVGHDFTVSCPGTNNFTFAGPPIDTWSACVTFNLPSGNRGFRTANPGGDCKCGTPSPDSPCCTSLLDYDATVTTSSGFTFTWSYLGGHVVTPPVAGLFAKTTISLVEYPVLLLPGDGGGATTISGTITYVSRATDPPCPIPSQTVTHDFVLNLCDGLVQTVFTPEGPCVG